MTSILKADGLSKKRKWPHIKLTAIPRAAPRKGVTPLKVVDFSKVSIAAGKAPTQPQPPEQPTEPYQRPPAVYGNIPSAYGVFDELRSDWLKKKSG